MPFGSSQYVKYINRNDRNDPNLKKHIDLSSEPLTLVCTAGLPPVALRDSVKEVAIFRSHKSIPIVIATEGFDIGHHRGVSRTGNAGQCL